MTENRPPRISIVTPSLNQGEYIGRTIRSVLDQQAGVNVEHIVVDGGSTDQTPEVLRRFEGQIHVISGSDRGMSDALNKGFSRCRGEIIGWLNSDDVYLPGCIRKVTDYFALHPDCQWLYGQCIMIGENDREVRRWITRYKNRKAAQFSFRRLLIENYISQPAVFFRKSFLESAGLLDISLKTAMDYDLWLRFALRSEPGVIHDPLAAFRVHRKSLSANNYRSQFEEQYRIHARYDHRRFLLFRHRIMITFIVMIYRIMGALPRRK